LKSALFLRKEPLSWRFKKAFYGGKIGLFPLKRALFYVENCPFSQKSALLLERKKAFYGEEKNVAIFR